MRDHFHRLAVGLLLTVVAWPWIVRADDEETQRLLKTFVAEFVPITPGEGQFPAAFEMGRADGQPNERPPHAVKLGHSFAIAKYEVPQNLYEAEMQANPSRWKGRRNSVEMMSWDEAIEFCQKGTELARSSKLIASDEIFRLPTEAEWEYCCRAGTTTRYSFGDDAQKPDDVSPKARLLDPYGWHTGNAAGNDPPVGALKPNPWGLYDMHGYLWELTADAWTADYSDASAVGTAKAVGPDEKLITIRSGSWKDDFSKLTSSSRRSFARTGKDDAVGFRCVKSKKSN